MNFASPSQLPRTVALATIVLLAVAACLDQRGLPSAPSASAGDGNGPATLSLDLSKGCAVVVNDSLAGTLTRARIPATLLSASLPARSAAQRDSGGRSILHVLTAEIKGSTRTAGLACILPASYSTEAFTAAILGAPGLNARLEAIAQHGEHVTSESGRPAILAARFLMAPYLARGKLTRTVAAPTSIRQPPKATRYYGQDCCDTYVLPTIYIYASATQYITDLSDIYWILHDHGYWPGTYATDAYYDCASASDKYFADQAALWDMQEDSMYMAQAVSSVQNYSCVRQFDGKKTCLDWFITSKKVFLVLNGDGRTYDSTAGYLASRVQMYIDFENKTGVAYVNHTTVGWGSGEVGVNPYPHQKKDMLVHVLSDSVNVVEFHLYNGFCTYVGRAACPAIDGFVEFRKRGGEWVPTDVDRDPFPTMAIYREGSDGLWHTLYQDPEGYPAQLMTLERTIEKWRNDMEILPPGCNLE